MATRGGDAQGQNHRGCAGKARTLSQLTDCVSEILKGVVEPVQPTHVTALLLSLRNRPHLPERLPVPVFGAHPGGSIPRDFTIEVVLEFLVEFLLYCVTSH